MRNGHRSAWRRRVTRSRTARIAVPLAIPVALALTLGIVLAVSGHGNSTISQSALGSCDAPAASPAADVSNLGHGHGPGVTHRTASATAPASAPESASDPTSAPGVLYGPGILHGPGIPHRHGAGVDPRRGIPRGPGVGHGPGIPHGVTLRERIGQRPCADGQRGRRDDQRQLRHHRPGQPA